MPFGQFINAPFAQQIMAHSEGVTMFLVRPRRTEVLVHNFPITQSK